MIKKFKSFGAELEVDYILRDMYLITIRMTKTTFLNRLYNLFNPKDSEIMLDDQAVDDMIDFLKNIQNGKLWNEKEQPKHLLDKNNELSIG